MGALGRGAGAPFSLSPPTSMQAAKNSRRACCNLVYCMDFKVNSGYLPAGDQARAIEELTRGVRAGEQHQVLLGVTGSGKTFTVAKVIEEVNRPALVLAHNKVLAAQLYHEFKQ